MLVVASTAFILVVQGMVFLMMRSFSNSLAEVQSAYFVTAYIESSVSPANEKDVVSAVRKIPGISSAQLVSKDAFLRNFSKFFPQLAAQLTGSLENLDADTIPRYVKVKANVDTATELQSRLMQVKGIESVELNKNQFKSLIHALVLLKRFSLVLLVGISVALIGILLNHFKQRSGFQSQMRKTFHLFGASGYQIYLPFALEGMIEGGMSGILAALGLLAVGRIMETQMGALFSAMGYQPYHLELGVLAIGLVAVGLLSGMMGSLWMALRLKD